MNRQDLDRYITGNWGEDSIEEEEVRYTKRDAESAFHALATALGKKTEGREVGTWRLDYNSTYGGYVIEEYVNDHGAVTRPFGSERGTAREFCDKVWYAVEALRYEERQK